MVTVRGGVILGAATLLIGCAGQSAADNNTTAAATTTSITTVATTVATTEPTTTDATSAAAITTDAPGTTEPDEGDRDCVVTVESGDSLSAIADSVDGVNLAGMREENRLPDQHVIHPGDELDVCVGNDVDDVTGASRLPAPPAAVRRQQQHLNNLFARYRIADLAVDGDSGQLTRQLLCAARMGLGLRVSAANMPEGSPEETALFEADSLAIPDGAPVWSSRWILIDKTCQVMFTGEGDERIVNVYPTSTGETGYDTSNVQGTAAFRFDPALDNGGWHDSTHFPVAIDNPQNGNMYKPIYFHGGQAIHGANFVPPFPRSKGCARMFTWHQDELLGWLGLDDVTEPTWQRGEIGVTVTVRGDYLPAD